MLRTIVRVRTERSDSVQILKMSMKNRKTLDYNIKTMMRIKSRYTNLLVENTYSERKYGTGFYIIV